MKYKRAIVVLRVGEVGCQGETTPTSNTEEYTWKRGKEERKREKKRERIHNHKFLEHQYLPSSLSPTNCQC